MEAHATETAVQVANLASSCGKLDLRAKTRDSRHSAAPFNPQWRRISGTCIQTAMHGVAC